MESLSAYKYVLEIARRAASEYNSMVHESPKIYAENVIDVYCSSPAPVGIKGNVYFMYLLEQYPGIFKNEVIKLLDREDRK
tara:strand:+ start:612 stop:854 length:243 start_codon:yes stop_codon:yes gene_type:complete